ncbi:amino acid permease [Kribbella solani]|uniref:Amino acid efflux transporter n=1 Tax=Kribbella solani TaxID=236067 RepID=A0A841DLN1_9ACTN|nr:amino acid permease [Kribbella solani]MBB5977570.1 amino acid efflux transporter [Kribbella solani]
MTSARPGGRLSLGQGTALYVGAVLATGVIALPALAAEVAGPASLLAWLGLAIVSAPLAATFAALGARYPDSGGVATYARLAFGDKAAAVVGWCFYLSVPVGGPAAALWAGGYVEAGIGGGDRTVLATMLVLILAVPATNAFGIQVTGRVQIALAALLAIFLVGAVALSLPHADLANLHPFAPHGWQAIGSAAALLVWSFVGWEAVTHLTGEFRRPDRDVPRATAIAVVVVGVLYLSVAFATITVLGTGAGETDAPLGDLLAIGLGGNPSVLAACAALLLSFGAMNAYYAGASKLGAALARDGSLPTWLAHGSAAGEIPRRSLALLAGMSTLTALVVVAVGITPSALVLLTTGLFVTVYAVGVAAAVKLLPKGSKARLAALLAQAAVVVLLLMSGRYLIWPLIVTTAALGYRWFSTRQRRP